MIASMKPKLTKVVLSPLGASRVISGQDTFLISPGINVLVGPNGCGKSTLINSLGRTPPLLKTTETTGGQILSCIFDTEKDNPRSQGYFDNQDAYNQSLELNWYSHGQAMAPLVTMGLRNALEERSKENPEAGLLGCLDEPENGLDFDGVFTFLGEMKKLVSDLDAQIIISSHSPLIWQSEGVTCIEFVPGYKARVLAAHKEAALRG